MKGNIEEDIKTMENIIKSYIEADECGLSNNDFKCEILALSNILSDYKRVLKENKKIRNGRNRLFEYATAQQTTPEMLNKILREDYIPKVK